MLQFSKYAQSTLSWKDKFSTLSANIIFLGWNPGCCWQVPSCLHGGSLCWTGLQKPTYLSSLILLVILGISCRQLVASLQAGPTWWCWRWGLRPRTLHSSALLSGDASSYYYPCGKTWICLAKNGSVTQCVSVFTLVISALSSFSRLWWHMECAPGQNSISTTLERNPKTLRRNRWSSYFPYNVQSWMILSVSRLRDCQMLRFICKCYHSCKIY